MSAVHLVRPDEGIVGPLRILAGAAQTGGRYFALEWEALPSSPDPRSFHVHEAESESEYVVSGEREISCGDETLRGSAGLFVLVPPRMRHTIRTVNDAPSRWLHFFAPAGLERFFVERERMKAAGSGVAEIAKVAARFGIGDIASRPPERELFVRPSASDEATRRVVVSGEETSGAYALVETSDLRADQHVHAAGRGLLRDRRRTHPRGRWRPHRRTRAVLRDRPPRYESPPPARSCLALSRRLLTRRAGT